jgi:hypothetical protein
MPPVQVYVVGRVLRTQGGYIAWELLGIFSDQPTAVQKCVKVNDFYAPVNTDTDLRTADPPIAGGVFPNS